MGWKLGRREPTEQSNVILLGPEQGRAERRMSLQETTEMSGAMGN